MSRVSGKPYCTYILWSESIGRFYIGVSEDPHHRLKQHNESGRGWAARYRPWVLVYELWHSTYSKARRHELELKRQKGGQGFYGLTGLNPQGFARRKRGS